MTFQQSIKTVFSKYADFTGTASLPEFWWWVLFNVLVSAALRVIGGDPAGDAMSTGNALVSLWSIAVLLPGLAVAVRRLRDANYGWGNLFWGLIPVIGIFIVAYLCAQPSQKAKIEA